MIWPFSLYLSSKEKKQPQKYISILILSLIIYFLSQTNSRNGILSFFSFISLILGVKISLIIIFSVLLIFMMITSFTNLIWIKNTFLSTILPLDLLFKSVQFYKLNEISNFPRIEVWNKGLSFIIERPLLGWGAGSFYLLFISKGGWNAQHLHNLQLDLAYKYGIVLSAILSLTIFMLIFKALIKTSNNKNRINIDRCLCASSFSIMVFHLNDITFYDGKISILLWILLASLKFLF